MDENCTYEDGPLSSTDRALWQLCEAWGVQPWYEDVRGQRREAEQESLLAVLRELGAPVTKRSDVEGALQHWQDRRQNNVLEPVILAWDGGPSHAALHLPSRQSHGKFSAEIIEESGVSRKWGGRLEELPEAIALSKRRTAPDKILEMPSDLPLGYHRLHLETHGQHFDALLMTAPMRAYSPTGRGWRRSWGAFLPLHALHSERSWGAGDFADLRQFREWVQGLGGDIVGTLPLLAAFLDEPFEISPYSPVSRLFWNEFYLNVLEVPEVRNSAEAKRLLESSRVQDEVDRQRAGELVDYRGVMRIKRHVLEALARSFFSNGSRRRREFESYVSNHAYLRDYANFRAIGEKLRRPWPEWPRDVRDGGVSTGAFSDDDQRYHMYVQWLADQQLRAAAGEGESRGLYLDLPLGVNANGYDVWRERDLFVVGVSGGCPPDIVFPEGQNWGFVPLHPRNIRRDGYRYVRDFVRHQMKYAKVLRIDHMPSFHRIYWIPPGAAANEGVYVRYPAEELYAVFALESHRHRTLLIGEDLGTVPADVPAAMARHNVHRMYVVEYEARPDPHAALPEPPASSVASVNTHDMPPFAGFWEGHDTEERITGGITRADRRENERTARREVRNALRNFLRSLGYGTGENDSAATYEAILRYLGDSPARVTLVNLEDIWQEITSQNVPTADATIPNWRRKAARSLEELSSDDHPLSILRQLNEAIRGGVRSPAYVREGSTPEAHIRRQLASKKRYEHVETGE